MGGTAERADASYRGGHGTPLVLLHGVSMSWRAWRPVLGELERHHEVFAPTMSGHRGGQPWADGVPVRVPALVDAVCAQLDDAGIDAAHVAGNSLGGWVALELARRGRALSCVALSPAGAWRRPLDLRRLVASFRVAMALGRPAWIRRLADHPQARRVLLRRIMEHGERIPPDEVPGLFDDLVGCAMLDEFLAGARPEDAIEPLASASCPIRVAWAEHDRTIPWARYGVPMRDRLPGAEVVRLPGCGHVPMWDDPELVVRTILQVSASGSVRSAG